MRIVEKSLNKKVLMLNKQNVIGNKQNFSW